MSKDGSVYIGERMQGQQGILWSASDLNLRPSTAERAIRRVQRQLGLPYLNLFESQRFARACQASLEDVDVILERLSWTGYGGNWAARRLGKPHVIEYNGDPLHDLDAKGMAPSGVQRWGSIQLMRKTLHRTSKIVASGEGWHKQLVTRWGIPEAKVVTVQNGTGLLDLLHRRDLRCFDETIAMGSSVQFIYLGGFQPWQGVETLLSVFSGVRSRLPDSALTLIGDGPGQDAAKDLALDLGLGNHARFVGAMAPEAYAPLLAQADIGLSPYCGWSEFEGLKIFDYKAAGLAVVASGIDGQPASVTSGPIGMVVPPCDGDSLAEAMVDLGRNFILRREMGRRARIEAETSHGWDHTARAMEEALMGCLPDHLGLRL